MNLQEPNATTQGPRDRDGQATLESWKEIAAYLQRDAKTARRWEKEEGLPVHRHSHKRRSSVYAYPSEIDAWRASRRTSLETASVPFWRAVLVPPSLAFVVTTLACLAMVGSGVRTASAQPLTSRPLCTDCWANAASVDGHWMATDDPATGDLLIRDVFTNKTRRLMAKSGSYKDSPAYAESPVLSLDSKRVAYVWYTGEHYQLRVVMSNQPGARSQVVRECVGEDYCEPAAWSADAQSMLAWIWSADQNQDLVWVSLRDGAKKTVKSVERRAASGRISPERALLRVLGVCRESGQIATCPGRSAGHAYLPSRRGRVQADRSGEKRGHQQSSAVDAGWQAHSVHQRSHREECAVVGRHRERQGRRCAIHGELQHWRTMARTPLSITRAGSYTYRLSRSGPDQISVVEIDPAGRRVEGQKEAVQDLVGIRPTWSPDGKSLAFKRHHPGNENAYDLMTYSLETGAEKSFPTDLGFTGFGPPAWSRDGKSLFTGLGGSQHTPGSYRVDLATGEWTKFSEVGTPTLSPDEKTLYALRPGALVAIDRATGKETKICPADPKGDIVSNSMFALSRDGRTVAVWRREVQEKRHILRRSWVRTVRAFTRFTFVTLNAAASCSWLGRRTGKQFCSLSRRASRHD